MKENRGAAGVDRITLPYMQEQYGLERLLAELQADLREGTYRPAPARRVDIPKPQGGKRPLGISTVRGRVARQAAKLVLEPIFEADFPPCSYGFRPKRSAMQVMEQLRTGFIAGYCNVAEFDIRNFFGEIGHDRLLAEVPGGCWTAGGNYFRAGNAAAKFRQADWCGAGRLRGLIVKNRGRNPHARQASAWIGGWFNGHGLYRLHGTIRYPRAV